MVETIPPGARAAIPLPRNAPTISPPKEFLNPDGSAIPDIIAYHHRPEDLGDLSDQTVPDETDSTFFGEDGMTFGDLLDIINPLQHIPILSTIYRALTGDEISPGARIAGGALFGGPIGLVVALVNAAVETSTGEDIGDTILTALTGDAPTKTVQTAAATQPAETAAAEPDLAILRIGTMPISLLPKANVAAQRPAAPTRPPIAVGVPFIGNGLPFGGMGALPFASASETANDPVAAVLQARAAVPMAGPVPGLGRAPLGRVDRQSPRLAVGRQSPPPIIDRRLSDKLVALAAKTAAQPMPTEQGRGADDKRKPIERNAAPAARAQFAPTGTVSQAMLNALDRYRRMKQAEMGTLSSG